MRARIQAVGSGDLAWLAVVPCALLTAAIVMLLGPALGPVLSPRLDVAFWPSERNIHPEPTEHSRYLLALLAPLLASVLVLAGARRPLRLPATPVRLLVRIVQTLTLVALGTFLVAQHIITFGPDYTGRLETIHVPYFTWTTIGVAWMLAPAMAFLVPRVHPNWIRDTNRRRAACALAALLFTAAWLLTAINSDRTIGNAHWGVIGFVQWTMDEAFAVVNGRSPLVDFHSQYSSLWPYLAGGTMLLLGPTLVVLTTFMATVSGLALISVYAVFHRATRSAVAALALFAPFVAIGFFTLVGPLENRYAPSNLFSMFPVRIAGPYLLLWLTARHLDRVQPRRSWPLFLVAGLAMLNNIEFGAAAFAATVAALVWSRRVTTLRAARNLVVELLLGLVLAFAAVALLTLIRTGDLPHLRLLLEYLRLYSLAGWGMRLMPDIGFHDAVFLTHVAAIVVATVYAVDPRRDRLLPGLLAWSGIFGLGASSYYVGNSHYENLILVFSPWALTLSLLVVATIREIAARQPRRPTFAELAVLVAFGIAICSLAQIPTPWSQIRRLGDVTRRDRFRHNLADRFVAGDALPGERVAILLPLGHRIAHDQDLVNVSPYAAMESIATREQLATTIGVLRAEGGTKLYYQNLRPDQEQQLSQAGFALTRRVVATDGTPFVEWTDRRAPP